jgi:hypothetical protein
MVEVEVEVVELHLKVNTETCMVNIINIKFNFVEVDEETLYKEELMEVVVEVIKVNN